MACSCQGKKNGYIVTTSSGTTLDARTEQEAKATAIATNGTYRAK